MHRRLILTLSFLATCLAAGFVFWRNTDWWCYVEIGTSRIPKFKLNSFEQFAISAAVGSVVAGAVVCVLSVIWSRRSGDGRERPNNLPTEAE